MYYKLNFHWGNNDPEESSGYLVLMKMKMAPWFGKWLWCWGQWFTWGCEGWVLKNGVSKIIWRISFLLRRRIDSWVNCFCMSPVIRRRLACTWLGGGMDRYKRDLLMEFSYSFIIQEFIICLYGWRLRDKPEYVSYQRGICIDINPL